MVSSQVVQALPSQDVQRLNRALMRLAKRPRDVEALVEAGEASLAVEDFDAAIGFFGRADEISPNVPEVKLGMARVYLRAGRAIEALPMFAAAQAAGAETEEYLSDRALAFDLLGDQPSAQAAYRRAIQLHPDDREARRRLALSLAISGERNEFEEILRPLIDQRDFTAIRARAFGLAILGEHSRASAIAGAVMPRDLSGRMDPYFEFMPRLTRSQQAAAANLGIFPRAADIGRDNPQIAAYRHGAAPSVASASAPQPTVPAADRRLEPAGEPLGQKVRVAAATAPPPTPVPAPASAPEPHFDLARVGQGGASAAASATSAPTRNAAPVVQPAPSVADAFADLGQASSTAASPAKGAVDIGTIRIPREKPAAPEPAKPAEPAHPSRIWVQVATGRDVDALAFDWRRYARKAPGLLGDLTPHVTPWGQANRLLAGPLKSREAQRALIEALSREEIESFGYVSPEGTEIKPIK